jgi:hypothetical protein
VSVQLTINVKRAAPTSTFPGEINDAELLSVSSLIRSHPDFDPSFSEIMDFSGVTTANLSSSAVQEASRRPSSFNPASMCVVVAPQDLIFGLGRMSQVFAEKTRPNAAVVRTIEEAHRILGSQKIG